MMSRFLSVLLCLATTPIFAQTAEWVWHPDAEPAAGDVRYFRRSFSIPGKVRKAEVQAVCDDEMTLFLNGKEVGKSNSWKEPIIANLAGEVRTGENVLAVQGKNTAGVAALVVILQIEQEDGKRETLLSNRTWLSSTVAAPGWKTPGFAEAEWTNVKLIAKLGAPPWGNVFNLERGQATPADELAVLPGFKVELLKSATEREGSWISMAIDEKGRLYISPQAKAADGDLMRLTLDASGKIVKTDWIKLDVSAAMGMLWAFDSLYVSGQGPNGQAIYRLRDTNGDDELDAVTLFKEVPKGGGEHGAHALVLGPDGKSIYIAHGNSTPPVEGVAGDSPYRGFQEDTLLPRIDDPVATFFAGIKLPYGHIYRTDENGTKWELFAGGFRNQYDLDFNPDGELFTYDSDMEWDLGLPWYRPTRILHVTRGAEFGFREGSAKWPASYPDSLPAVVDVGLGSPTGVKFGTKSNFPRKYQRAFFAMDWTFGRILAVHMRPKGASYTASNPLPSPYLLQGPHTSPDVESFISGKGLPVTDLEFGRDGAMYFTVGGRGTQAGLYRVSYIGAPETAAPAELSEAERVASLARAFRRELEGDEPRNEFRTPKPGQRIQAAGENDRAIYFAARQSAERLPLESLRKLALEDPKTVLRSPDDHLFTLGSTDRDAPRVRSVDGLMGLLALARAGDKKDQSLVLRALGAFPLESLDEELKLIKLRILELTFARHGRPDDEMVKLAGEKLGRHFPASSFPLNRQFSQLLVWLDAPEATEKTLTLLQNSADPAEQIWFAYVLRTAKTWTPAQREKYFAWFSKARAYKGGNSLPKFILKILEQALAAAPAEERARLAALSERKVSPAKTAQPAPARTFQKAWTTSDFATELTSTFTARNFARGKEIYASTQCLQCHHMGADGGNVGPDLTAVGNRFSRRDLLEAILEPSKAISEQYASYLLTSRSGETLMGQIAEENNDALTLIVDPIAGTKQRLRPSQIVKRELSPTSLMPPGLLNTLSKEEVLDLLAYLESGGNPEAAVFQARK
ncbi:MAG TPA: c-type cytochrome [Chthoniobacteraceae bacterium]|jgi:putative heme-binding domain-containing protein